MTAHPKIALPASRHGRRGDPGPGSNGVPGSAARVPHETARRELLPLPSPHLTWLGVLGELVLIATVAAVAFLAVLS